MGKSFTSEEFYVGITDTNWFSLLREDYSNGILSKKVNFWTPGTREFKVLKPGELFLFKLHNKKSTGENGEIVGGGYFSHYCKMPIDDAWKQYARGNGRESLEILRKSLKGMQEKNNVQSNVEIGCIILENVFFLDKWIDEPSDWGKSIVSGKKYTTDTEAGVKLYNLVENQIKQKTFVRPQGAEIGQFYSWIVKNDNIAAKETDKSVFENHGSGIPKEIRWFFEANELRLEDKLDLVLEYEGDEYKAYIKKEAALERTRMFWYSDLSAKFNSYYEGETTFPILLFERKGYARYKISFLAGDKKKLVEPLDNSHSIEEQEQHAITMDAESLKAAAESHSRKKPVEKEVVVKQVTRDPYVAEYAKQRAHGVCQLCGEKAPFMDAKGRPYLESHHIIWIAKGGEDSVNNTVGLCPNCHRKMHVVADLKDIEYLLDRVTNEN